MQNRITLKLRPIGFRMKNTDVAFLQSFLLTSGYNIGSAGVDSVFGPQTCAALKLYQKANGLAVDGICGPKTWAKIDASYLAAKPTGKGDPNIIHAQERLHAWGFGDMCGSIDGIQGGKTTAAFKQFQACMGLAVDGIPGKKTMAALDGTPIVPRIPESELICQCTRYANKKYCNGWPNGINEGIAVRILSERIFIEVDKVFPGTQYFVCNIDSKSPNGVAGGHRCTKWNTERGGASGSQHKVSHAMDIFGRNANYAESKIRNEIEKQAKKINTKGGVGYGADWIVHIDTRGYSARWKY